MTRPGTRFFIGPLTPAQQRRRQRAREKFRKVSEIADARNITMREAFEVIQQPDRVYWYASQGVEP